MLEAVGAERAILSILMKEPTKLFDVDDILDSDDFVNSGNRIIFSVIQDLVTNEEKVEIDQYVLISHAEQKGIRDFLSLTENGDLLEALNVTKNGVTVSSLNKHVYAVKTASIKRTLLDTIDRLKDEIEDFSGDPIDLRNLVEEDILQAMEVLDAGDDEIVNLADDFEEIINNYADIAATIGLSVGFERWEKDVAALRNGTVTGIFARAKEGKSQIAAHSLKEIGIEGSETFGRLPVLYLDTEMQARDQQMRLCSQLTTIPYAEVEDGSWKQSNQKIALIKEAFGKVKDAPIYYKNISGKSVSYVIPIIRKFLHKHVGGKTKGITPRCLVIYDYVKLMDPKDLKHAQEYQILGFLLGALHDLSAKWNFPMLVLGQLNREGLKTDSLAAIAGSDRITHNVDSLSIFRKKRQEEIDGDGEMRGTHILKALIARNGPGHDFDDWVNITFDKSAGQFQEDKRNSERVAAIEKIDAIKDRLKEQDTAPFGDIREE